MPSSTRTFFAEASERVASLVKANAALRKFSIAWGAPRSEKSMTGTCFWVIFTILSGRRHKPLGDRLLFLQTGNRRFSQTILNETRAARGSLGLDLLAEFQFPSRFGRIPWNAPLGPGAERSGAGGSRSAAASRATGRLPVSFDVTSPSASRCPPVVREPANLDSAARAGPAFPVAAQHLVWNTRPRRFGYP